VVDLLVVSFASIIGLEADGEFSWLVNNVVLSDVLITMGVSSNDDGSSPAWHKSRNVLADDGLSEDGSIKDISDGSIGRSPHFLKFELFDSLLIGSDGSALDSDLVLLDSVSSIDSDLIVSVISVFHSEIIVVNVKIKIRVDMLILDPLPDDSSHLVTIEFNDGVGNSQLGESSTE
jgi:hypothetical protein